MPDDATIAKVRLLSPAFANLADDLIQMYLDDAWLTVQHEGFPKEMLGRAVRYYAAHLVWSSVNTTTSTIKSVKADDLEKEFALASKSADDVDTFWIEYQSMLKRFGNGGFGFNLTVVP